MERMRISLSEEDLEIFERRRLEAGMSKAAFVRLLLAEHDQSIPAAIKYKEIIEQLSNINTSVKAILINERIETEFKIALDEKMKALTKMISEKM